MVHFERDSRSKQGIPFSYQVYVTFPEENDRARICVPKLIDYRSDDSYCIFYNCDIVNNAWPWVKFYTDRSDTTVTAEYDCVLNDSPTAGDSVLAAVTRLDEVIVGAIDKLLPYRK